MLHILLSLALAPVGPPLADASALLEANLTMRWQSPSSGNLPKIVTSFGDKTIIFDHTYSISCYQRRSGKKLWNKIITTPSEQVLDIEPITDSSIAVITPRRTLLLQIASGKELTPSQVFGITSSIKNYKNNFLLEQKFKKPLSTKCIQKKHMLIGGTLQGSILWHDMLNGFSKGSIQLGKTISVPPLDCGKTIVAASQDGQISGISASSLVPIWKKGLIGNIEKTLAGGQAILEINRTFRTSLDSESKPPSLNLFPQELIISLNNTPIKSIQDFSKKLRLIKTDDEFTLQVLKKNGDLKQISLSKSDLSKTSAHLNGFRLQERNFCFITTEDNFITAIDAHTGQIQWQEIFSKKISGNPYLYKGSLYITFNDNSMLALNPFLEGKPEKKWEAYGISGSIIGSFERTLYLWDSEKHLYSHVDIERGLLKRELIFNNAATVIPEKDNKGFFLVGNNGSVARIVPRITQ